MRSIEWFWTTGIHDPAWVQAVTSVALLGVTLVTLIVLFFYAWDTHTLAKTSVEQIDLIKKERSVQTMRNVHAAFDCFFKVRDDLNAIVQSFVDNTFGTKPQPPSYPDNWPDVASALNLQNPSTMQPTIALGIQLRHVDFAVREFNAASNNNDKIALEEKVKAAVLSAGEECTNLWQKLPKAENV
jgi:hypothetical protein